MLRGRWENKEEKQGQRVMGRVRVRQKEKRNIGNENEKQMDVIKHWDKDGQLEVELNVIELKTI